MLKNKNFLLPSCIALGVAAGASADMVLTLDDVGIGGVEVIIADGQGSGFVTASGLVTTHADPDGVADGAVSFSGAVPGGSVFDVNFTTGISKPLIGSTAIGRIDLASINVSGTGAGSLQIGLTDTDFSNNGLFGFEAQIGGTTDGLVDFFAAVDAANQEFGASSSVFQNGLGSGSFSTTLNGSETFAGAYSLSMLVDIHHTLAGQVTDFDAGVNIPAPGALALAGLALAVGRRRRRSA